MKALYKARKGQGLVEYAGALVVAAVLVAAIVTLAPTQLNGLFTSVFTYINTQFGISG